MKFNSSNQAMAWLHTWLGLIFGFILMVCFFFGTLSVFDLEIDRWAIPETRFEPQPMPSFDKVLLPLFKQLEADEDRYKAVMPKKHDFDAGPMTSRAELIPDEYWAYTTHRDPVLRIGAGFLPPHPKDPDGHNHIHGEAAIDPRSGEVIPSGQLKIGSEWLYPLHFSLHVHWNRLGKIIVGLASFFMLVALVTGVIIHRNIFREFFTFRPWKKTARSTLDLHNMTGVLGLPFHFFFTLTGLIIFAAYYYLPVTHTVLSPLHDHFETVAAEEAGLPDKRSGIPAPLASVDAMVTDAKRIWSDRGMPGEVGYLVMHHLGDENGYISIFRAPSDRVALVGEGIHFKASTGEVLREDPAHELVSGFNDFLISLHLIHFEHWLLRWFYVFGGLIGCVCIATGFIFFIKTRQRRHAKYGRWDGQVIEAIAIAAVTGLVIATFSMLVANRWLLTDWADKGEWEKNIFLLSWLASLIHGFARMSLSLQYSHSRAWVEQCWIIAVLAITAVASNAVSTGDHLYNTIFINTYWPVAGVDLSLLASGCIAIYAAKKLSQTQPVSQTKVADEKGRAVYE